MMLTMFRGILPIPSFSVPQAKKTGALYSGMHDVRHLLSCYYMLVHEQACPESRYIQQCSLKVSPVQTNYAPDGRSLLYVSAGHQLFFMTFGKTGEEAKEEWHLSEREAVRRHPL